MAEEKNIGQADFISEAVNTLSTMIEFTQSGPIRTVTKVKRYLTFSDILYCVELALEIGFDEHDINDMIRDIGQSNFMKYQTCHHTVGQEEGIISTLISDIATYSGTLLSPSLGNVAMTTQLLAITKRLCMMNIASEPAKIASTIRTFLCSNPYELFKHVIENNNALLQTAKKYMDYYNRHSSTNVDLNAALTELSDAYDNYDHTMNSISSIAFLIGFIESILSDKEIQKIQDPKAHTINPV